MLIFRYNKRETPSAPYIELKIMPTGRARKPTKRQAKLDSGASITVIPESLIRRWRIPFVATIAVRGYNGHVSVRPTYKVDILIGTRRFDNLEVTIASRRNILLGRDIMNKLRITLDGARETVEIHDA